MPLPLKYFKKILSRLIFFTLSLSIISCTTGGASVNKQELSLIMHVEPKNLVGDEKTIAVHFSLANNAERAMLNEYQLKATITPKGNNNSKLLYSNFAGNKRVPNTANNITLFTERSELGLEDEILIIPFNLVPATNADNLIVTFELLDDSGKSMQTKQVAWQNVHSANLTMAIPGTRNQVDVRGSDASMPISYEVDNSLVKDHKRKVSSIYNHEEDPTVELESKHLEKPRDFDQPSKKSKYIERKAHGQEYQNPIQYGLLNIKELAMLANSNDRHAQEAIIDQYLKGCINPILGELITPFSWQGIQQKALEDERYVFLLLNFFKQAKEHPLYIEIFGSVEIHAQSGNPLAQNNLGWMYQDGLGVVKDEKQAFEWYKKAADQEYAAAQNNLGWMYYNGVVGDKRQAFELFQKAANQEYAAAQTNLGTMYYKGEGVDKDVNTAFKWLQKAADQGDGGAQSNLGWMYYNGLGVVGDKSQAFEWYKKAADQGDVGAQGMLGTMYYKGEGVDKDVNTAFKWLQKAADQGDGGAQCNLGVMYLHGEGAENNFNIAFELFQKSANQGLAKAQYYLGFMYQNGYAVEKNLAQAIFWFIKAKSKQGLLSFFSFNAGFSSESNTSIQEEMNTIIFESLLPKWQSKIVQQGRDRVNTHVELHLDAYRALERILAKLISWHHQLNTQTGLLLNCLRFKSQTYISNIVQHQKATQVIPYIKQYTALHGKNYVSFGEANVKLSDKIIDELIHKQLYNKADRLLEYIKKSYEYARIKASGEAIYIEEEIQQEGLDEKEKEILQKKLARANELNKLFTDKLQAIEEEARYFDTYYKLLFEQIDKGSQVRNQKFREENDDLFK
jgi:TPR repeat protein